MAGSGSPWRVASSVVDPERLTTNTLPPPVHIEDVTIDRRRVRFASRAEAPPGRGDLAFRYTGLSFLAPEKVRFKYKLEGYDLDWVDAGDRRAAYYSNIPPGPYTFRVKAANNDGVWNEAGASYAIHLAAAFLPDVLVLRAVPVRGGPGRDRRAPAARQEPEGAGTAARGAGRTSARATCRSSGRSCARSSTSTPASFSPKTGPGGSRSPTRRWPRPTARPSTS